ncbi:Wadjet anti-phage system protein JetD domain-containing protein [Lachnospiraceae bacterium 54-53]
MTLTDLILDKCERSARDWREGEAGNRSLRIQQNELNLLGKQNLLEQAALLEQERLIRCDRISGGSDISVVRYSLSSLGRLYEKAGRIPKSDRVRNLEAGVREQMEKLHKPWIRAYYEGFLKNLEEGKEPEELSDGRMERNFKCFLGIDKLEESVYKRIFSKQYLGDSKLFEKEMQGIAASAAKKYYDVIDENMTVSEILTQIYLDNYSAELALKGNLRIRISGHEIDLSHFTCGAVLNSETLKAVFIAPKQRIRKIITVENKANYMSYPYEEGTLVLFSHGYFSPAERKVLGELAAVLPAQEVEFYHTGDLDYGGIRIFEFIRQHLFPGLKPLHMDIRTWEKYSVYGYRLDPSKREKLKSMIDNGRVREPDLRKLAEVIYETGTGIEQESFLFTE